MLASKEIGPEVNVEIAKYVYLDVSSPERRAKS
jgi:hypothetical protein